MPKLLHWGYTLDHPTAWNVTKYLGFTFGLKWLLIALALIFAVACNAAIFRGSFEPHSVAFSFQFSIEVLANQKFLHIWVLSSICLSLMGSGAYGAPHWAERLYQVNCRRVTL